MFNLTAGLQGLQQIGDRFSQLRDELELSIEETIRAERVDGLPGAIGASVQGSRGREAGVVAVGAAPAAAVAPPAAVWPVLAICLLLNASQIPS